MNHGPGVDVDVQIATILKRIQALLEAAARSNRRTLIAISGPPGAGKSTLAARLVAILNGRVVTADGNAETSAERAATTGGEAATTAEQAEARDDHAEAKDEGAETTDLSAEENDEGTKTTDPATEANDEAPSTTAPPAALVPMDGFHLDNETLAARGLLARKGAPETFDAAGFVALVERLRHERATIRYPRFDRAADRVVADAAAVDAGTRVVVLEGNYLLLDSDPWCRLAASVDFTVLLAPPLPVLERRLVDRWLGHGHDERAARARAEGNDLVNARRVLERSRPPDLRLGDG